MSAERLEIEEISGAALIVLIVFALLGYFAWKNISLPSWAYPNQAWGIFSSGVDNSLDSLDLSKTDAAGRIDDFLARIFEWLTDNFPSPPASKLGIGDGTGALIGTGTGEGNQTLSTDDFPTELDDIPAAPTQGQPLGV